jgi:hypothetical protein
VSERVSSTVPDAHKQAIVELTHELECTQSDLVADAVDQYLEKDRHEELRDTLLDRINRQEIIDKGKEESREAGMKGRLASRLWHAFSAEPRRREPHEVRLDLRSFREEMETVEYREPEELMRYWDVTVDAYARAYDEGDESIIETAIQNPDVYLSQYGVYRDDEGDGSGGTETDVTGEIEEPERTEEPDGTERTDGGHSGTGTATTDGGERDDVEPDPVDDCPDCTELIACNEHYRGGSSE